MSQTLEGVVITRLYGERTVKFGSGQVLWREFEDLRVQHEGRIRMYILKSSRIETGVVLEKGAGGQNSIPMTTVRGATRVQCAQFQWSDGPTQRLPRVPGSWHLRISVIFVHSVPKPKVIPVLLKQEGSNKLISICDLTTQ